MGKMYIIGIPTSDKSNKKNIDIFYMHNATLQTNVKYCAKLSICHLELNGGVNIRNVKVRLSKKDIITL